MKNHVESRELEQALTQLSPLSDEQWATVEEAEDLLYPSGSAPPTDKRAERTPSEIEREIAQDTHDLEVLLAQPHRSDGALAAKLLGVSDDLRHLAQGERLSHGLLLERGPRLCFGRRPRAAEEA